MKPPFWGHAMVRLRPILVAPLALLAVGMAGLLPSAAGQATSPQLVLRPGGERFASGDPIWWLELRQGQRQLGRWAAASGLKQQQTADRRWSPGNGAPLPIGAYSVGRPEPWGRDLWIDLQPLFRTTRSALGIHNCFPGVGCICLPDRAQLNELAALIRRHGVRRLEVLSR